MCPAEEERASEAFCCTRQLATARRAFALAATVASGCVASRRDPRHLRSSSSSSLSRVVVVVLASKKKKKKGKIDEHNTKFKRSTVKLSGVVIGPRRYSSNEVSRSIGKPVLPISLSLSLSSLDLSVYVSRGAFYSVGLAMQTEPASFHSLSTLLLLRRCS